MFGIGDATSQVGGLVDPAAAVGGVDAAWSADLSGVFGGLDPAEMTENLSDLLSGSDPTALSADWATLFVGSIPPRCRPTGPI